MKYLFSDLDGTLLYDLPNKTYGIFPHDIKKIQEENVRIVFCSGRGCICGQYLNQFLEMKCDMIGFNGAQLMINNKIISLDLIPKTYLIQAINLVNDKFPNLTNPFFMNWDCRYVLEKDDIEAKTLLSRHILPGQPEDVIEKTNLNEFIEPINEVPKIQFYVYDPKDTQRIADCLNSFLGDKLNFMKTNDHMIEGMLYGTSKAKGILRYIEYQKIDIKDCYAIGDAMNDVEMLELLYDHSFTLEHASKEVKKIPKYIVKSVSEAIQMIESSINESEIS